MLPVSLFDALPMLGRTRDYQAAIELATVQASYTDPSTYPIASPWSDPGELARIVASDIFGTDVPPINSRASAMRLPAVARGRNLMVSTIARFVPEVADSTVMLDAGDGLGPQPAAVDPQPAWLTSSTDGTSPQLRLAWTVDDLIFGGWSCWWRTYTDGVMDCGRVPFDQWRIDPDSRSVLVNEVPQNPDQVILIPGLHEGILAYGIDTLRDARNLYDIVRTRLDMPVPNIDLHQTGGPPLSDTERQALIDGWSAARRLRRGGVGFTSEHVEARELGKGGEELMIEARNAASLDLARLIGVSANRIDATSAKASLNYETTTGRNQEFVDFDLALYMTPITARLSLDDVVEPGKFVRFNLADFIRSAPSVTGPTLED
jgi:hypothetical protein